MFTQKTSRKSIKNRFGLKPVKAPKVDLEILPFSPFVDHYCPLMDIIAVKGKAPKLDILGRRHRTKASFRPRVLYNVKRV